MAPPIAKTMRTVSSWMMTANLMTMNVIRLGISFVMMVQTWPCRSSDNRDHYNLRVCSVTVLNKSISISHIWRRKKTDMDLAPNAESKVIFMTKIVVHRHVILHLILHFYFGRLFRQPLKNTRIGKGDLVFRIPSVTPGQTPKGDSNCKCLKLHD